MRCVMDSRLPHREGRKERKMAKASSIHLPTSIGGATTFISKPSSLYYPSHLWSKVMKPTKVHAKLGGGDGEIKSTGQKKKFITKEEEPDQYWQAAGERKGENPMTTPLPYIIIFGMSTPFVILAIAFANGWIKVPVR